VAAGGTPIGALLAVAGGAVAIASAWLPWITAPASYGSATYRAIDATDLSTLHSGYYPLIGGAIAAVFGLLLLLRIGLGASQPKVAGIGAVLGGLVVIAAEAVAYGWINDQITAYTAQDGAGFAIGYGLYVGLGAGIVGALGGLMVFLGRR
jgi:hypothetical protein